MVVGTLELCSHLHLIYNCSLRKGLEIWHVWLATWLCRLETCKNDDLVPSVLTRNTKLNDNTWCDKGKINKYNKKKVFAWLKTKKEVWFFFTPIYQLTAMLNNFDKSRAICYLFSLITHKAVMGYSIWFLEFAVEGPHPPTSSPAPSLSVRAGRVWR